jgi:hypothetical protein
VAQPFPDPGTKPGEYALEWLVGRRRFTGDVTLAPRRRPQIALRGTLRRHRRSANGTLVYGLPGPEIKLPRLVGLLRSNEEVVVIDVAVEEWLPERFLGFGQWAIVGLDIAGVPNDRYEHVTFQISDTDLWFGTQPLSKVTWPRSGDPTKTFSATLNRGAHHVWRDTRNGITVDLGYPLTRSLDPYRFGLTFAPVFDIHSRQPLTLDDWRDQWLAPLIDLASIATKRPQTLSWLNVQHGEGRSRRRGTVFTRGIHQSPYTAHYDEEWRRYPDQRPLFTLGRLCVTPMRLVRVWRSLQQSDDPFVELYRAALFQPELPPRARFLYLIQALEARHSFANRDADAKAQLAFVARREQVIEAAARAGLAGDDLRFLKGEWSKQRRDSLERRLLALLNELPPPVRQRTESDAQLDAIRSQLITADANATTFQAQLRALRNELSHGDRNYPDYELEPWVAAVETICQAQVLALLGFRASDIEEALRT